jgi:hypothetical protein
VRADVSPGSIALAIRMRRRDGTISREPYAMKGIAHRQAAAALTS